MLRHLVSATLTQPVVYRSNPRDFRANRKLIDKESISQASPSTSNDHHFSTSTTIEPKWLNIVGSPS